MGRALWDAGKGLEISQQPTLGSREFCGPTLMILGCMCVLQQQGRFNESWPFSGRLSRWHAGFRMHEAGVTKASGIV